MHIFSERQDGFPSDDSLAAYSQDLALPALFHKSWCAHEDRDSLTDAQIQVQSNMIH